MKRKLILPAILCLLLAPARGPHAAPGASSGSGAPGAAAQPAGATPQAVLMSVHGTVTVTRADGSTVAGTFGLQLRAGDAVKTGAGAQAEVLFEAGNWLQVGANSSIQIRGQRTAAPAAGASKSGGEEAGKVPEKSFEVAQSFLKLKNAEGTSALTGLRSGAKDADLVAVSPCQTKIPNGHPTFRWRIADPTTELKLTVYDAKGVHWSRIVKGKTDVLYPDHAPELSPGVDYSWTLETTDPMVFPPQRTRAAYFQVLPPEKAKAVEDEVARIAKDDKLSESSRHFLRASLYFGNGMIDQAIDETKAALASDPGNTALKTILAKLYAEAGRTKEAVETYNELMGQG